MRLLVYFLDQGVFPTEIDEHDEYVPVRAFLSLMNNLHYTYQILHNRRVGSISLGEYSYRQPSIVQTTIEFNKHQMDLDKLLYRIKQTILIYFDVTRQNQSQFVLTAVQRYTF